jgi:hypothetical protein
MGFRFRKSISVCKGVKINLSKTSVSTTIGGKVGRVTVGNKQVTTSASIPKTGISFFKIFKF